MKTNKVREALRNQNRLEIGRYYTLLDWPDTSTADRMNQEREELLNDLRSKTEFGCNDTKLDVSSLSPGCELCAAGKWSCLFINGQCNANCFYCPAEQNEMGVPQSNGLEFPTAGSWVDYIRKFKFKGLSLSGGEPFLSFDRSLEYLTAAKQAFGKDVYFWMYTNGILATEEKLRKLADAGLDEIRFDVGATGYNLKNLKKAIGIIPCVTVEIPAVPEESERLKILVRELAEAGVDHLNLHQLRMTGHNLPKFAERGYILSHGVKVTVPESELTALRLIKYVKDNDIPLPVNYCSFAFKNRYQHAAGRFRNAREICEEYESLTPNGYIRSLSIESDAENIFRIVKVLKSEIPGWQWYHEKITNKIFVHRDCLSHLKAFTFTLKVSYHVARIKADSRSIFAHREVYLNNNRKLLAERRPVQPEIEIKSGNIKMFRKIISKHPGDVYLDLFDTDFWQPIIYHEYIPYSLPDYF